jgi:hypothetical protein
MVQVPGECEVGRPPAVPVGADRGDSGFGRRAPHAPAADAEQALDPVRALTHHDRVTRVGVALDRDDRGAEGVVARDEVAAGTRAQQGCVGVGVRQAESVADMR